MTPLAQGASRARRWSTSLRARRIMAGAGLLLPLLWACSAGSGEGEVSSRRLQVAGCVDGPFDLAPDFFASNPHLDMQLITIQRGDQMFDLSDGITIAVYETSTVRASLGRELSVSLPRGVNPPGAPVEGRPPGLVALTLYLNDSCHEQDVSLQAVSGTMVFEDLFSGDLSDTKASERWIEGEFDVLVADPRDLPVDGSEPDDGVLSPLQGRFRFLFRRGPMVQAFP